METSNVLTDLSKYDNELLSIMQNEGKLHAVKFIFDKKLGYLLKDIKAYCDRLEDTEYTEHQKLVAAAVNTCKAINPNNPIKVAEVLPDMFGIIKFITEAHESCFPDSIIKEANRILKATE